MHAKSNTSSPDPGQFDTRDFCQQAARREDRRLRRRKPIPPSVRWSVFARDNYTCHYCGRKPPAVALVLDHLIPHAAGGRDEPANLRAACEECNAGKSNRDPSTPLTPAQRQRGGLTWAVLVAHAPTLALIRQEIEQIEDEGGPSFCANAVWFGHGGRVSYRNMLYDLVGWRLAKIDPLIGTQEAFDLAYKTLYECLPDCRNCWCG